MTLKMSPTAAGLNPMLFPTGDSHSTGPAILAVSWVFTAISAIVVGLKIWTRVKIIRETGLDDILTVIALVRGRISYSRLHQ